MMKEMEGTMIPEKNNPRSPLARLVLFMVCLSVAGSIVAGMHYAVVDIPEQHAAACPPANGDTHTRSDECMYTTYADAMWGMVYSWFDPSKDCSAQNTDYGWEICCWFT
jgi:hypothetical protein